MKLLFVFLLASFSVFTGPDPDDPIDVSMIQLIANPDKYGGKRVRVTGYLHQKFEDSGLYLSKEDADYLNGENALWLSFSEEPNVEPVVKFYKDDKVCLPDLDCRYVVIEGTVDFSTHGHMGSYQGEIKLITRVWELTRWYDGKKQLRK